MKRLPPILILLAAVLCHGAKRPNIVLVMADDMGWGQTGYYEHPTLKTPHLDAMAAHGLRFDRFYAGAPNCSPTRATVMTGRTNDRTGVQNHGYPLRPQEKTVAQAFQAAGYATGHFGKWHLNGMRGPGVPILKDDPRNPGGFGFDEWISVSNFFDRDPIMSRRGEFEEFKGDSSEIIVDLALKFIGEKKNADQAFFTVIWYGSPHSPFKADDKDRKNFGKLDSSSQHHYGELVAMDRSIGALRKGLRDLGIADNTLFWFCSDNGGLPGIKPGTVGDLRGFKGSVYEGGLRVPSVIEWPAGIQKPRVTRHPAGTVDIYPTLAAIAGLPASSLPWDGVSLLPLFKGETGPRKRPLGFRHTDRAAFIDNDYKLITQKVGSGRYELYDVENDHRESADLMKAKPELAARLIRAFEAWNKSVDESVAGHDYPEGRVVPKEPGPRTWADTPEYAPYLAELQKRPEYRPRTKKGK